MAASIAPRHRQSRAGSRGRSLLPCQSLLAHPLINATVPRLIRVLAGMHQGTAALQMLKLRSALLKNGRHDQLVTCIPTLMCTRCRELMTQATKVAIGIIWWCYAFGWRRCLIKRQLETF